MVIFRCCCTYLRFYRIQGGFAHGNVFGDRVRSQLLKYCAEMKDAAVSVADALAPPDFALNSVIGKSDGKVRLALARVRRLTIFDFGFSCIKIYSMNL